MRERIQIWVRKKAGELQELERELALLAQRCRGGPPPSGPGEAPESRRRLTELMDREIHRAYYQDGGFRFFGCALRQYAASALDREDSLPLMRAGAYNTNIRPMLRQLDKLEEALKDLSARLGCEPLELDNAQLLEAMRAMAALARAGRLDQEAGWTAEDYRRAVRSYAEALWGQLLDVYRPPAERP